MSLNKEKREAAQRYLLEQISNNCKKKNKKTSEAFDITPGAVYGYIRKFIEQGVIEKNDSFYKLVPTVSESFQIDLTTLQEGDESIIYETKIYNSYY